MHHPYRIREIAEQAGLSAATVDRVLNARPGVRPGTVAEVHEAIAELDRQRDQLRLSGQTFLLDLVMQAPERFSAAVRAALEAELPGLRPAVVRARFHLREEGGPAAVVGQLRRVRRRGSHGVLLKAPQHPDVVAEVDALAEAGVPVVTLVTDLPASRRVAYVGMDNQAAGATAAYLLTRFAPGSTAAVLVSVSDTGFLGERERQAAFVATMAELAPDRRLVVVDDTGGLDRTVLTAVSAVLAADPEVQDVYSIGGGNTAIAEAFRRSGRRPAAFVAHDLDADNTTLLRRRQLTAVLHHDLRHDLQQACRCVLWARGALPQPARPRSSPLQVITPYNVPGR